MNSTGKLLHSMAIIFAVLTFSGVAISAENKWGEAGFSVSRMQFDSEFLLIPLMIILKQLLI